ncbi:unnamed protein product [Rangifer tarandus platyrhynchus]|uniref:Uncharacterized protein n=2 Tax=Rangifer tarandus platyrhynchus TaxID=3082113 RepID=A0AC59Z1D8_RANTA|nr:unnamed protein product [Rangifer tarandus platyrhynchus]
MTGSRRRTGSHTGGQGHTLGQGLTGGQERYTAGDHTQEARMATPTLLTAEGSEGTQPGRSAATRRKQPGSERVSRPGPLPGGGSVLSPARAGGPFRGAGRAFSPHLHACVSYLMRFTRAAGLTQHDEP